ncbi:MAG: indolepyruvate ferredoxin oxidoreductase subunit alpha [Anaerolineaceae bacterium]|nr:indolepyruvate ferredoxin oxidoreductase subunit alpha [Anaerolineaceae bacterium]
MNGNEAIARGAYEYGVQVATGYPGTPSSEILENIAQYKEIYAEWSTNEKVATEAAIGAAYAGRRSVTAMKQVGMNVAADAFFFSVYTGMRAGMVLIVADDPGMFSSQNEQDNRHYARFAKMPMLEPGDSQESKDFVGIALELSEEWDVPVMLRTCMRVSHSATPVDLGEREWDDEANPEPWVRNQEKYVCSAMWARERRPMIEERIVKLGEVSNKISINRLEWGDRKLGIIAAGPVYNYAREVFPNASFLKLGMPYPLPKDLIQQLADGVETLLVIEELDPFVEDQVKAMGIQCRGKDIFKPYGELLPSEIERACAEAGLFPENAVISKRNITPEDLPGRSPVLCPGCPHRSTFYNLAKKKNLIIVSDIGCYNLGALAPFHATDFMGSMGAGFGVAHGFHIGGIEKTGQKVIGIVGDSTFFHNGITPLVNIVHNGGNSTLMILDNHTTAMTGHQDHPGIAHNLMGKAKQIDIETLVKACGVEHVQKIDAFNVKAVDKAIKDNLEIDEPSVIIMDGPCIFVGPEAKPSYEVDLTSCNGCTLCFRLGCPAIAFSDEMDEKYNRPKAMIDPVLCVGCDMCAQICPRHAISSTTEKVIRGS